MTCINLGFLGLWCKRYFLCKFFQPLTKYLTCIHDLIQYLSPFTGILNDFISCQPMEIFNLQYVKIQHGWALPLFMIMVKLPVSSLCPQFHIFGRSELHINIISISICRLCEWSVSDTSVSDQSPTIITWSQQLLLVSQHRNFFIEHNYTAWRPSLTASTRPACQVLI